MTAREELRERIARVLLSKPIGWNVDGEGRLWPPHHCHAEHRYDGGCAVCRFADRPEAFVAVLDAVLDALGLEQVGWLCGDCWKRTPGNRIEKALTNHGYFCSQPEPTAVYRLRDVRPALSEANRTNRGQS